ncbi:uncharacterized protein LOC6651581 isoform X3 [Drosophila willistoni]|uniref:uncharacterized protein LOC6651581 isoform X3 n=1 Tax=Drosophila willistoni TaxID=7260 RepID=UPI001F084C90|nr:uncharacterized protein LOC6651581 isoform X3 [Drosophila willistoni]
MTGTSLPRVPEGLRDLMKVFTKDVLREKPENLYQFSANYFDGIVSEKTPQAMRKYEPVQSYEAIMKNRIRQQVPLSLVFNIIPETLTELIKQFIKAVLKECPENIYVFAREYFHRLSIAKTTQNNRNTDYTTYEKYLEGKENARLAPKVTCECGRVLSAARTLEAIPLNEQNAQSSPLIIDKDNQQHERSYSVNYLRAVCIIQKHFRQYLKRKNATKKYNSHEYVTAIYIIQRQVRRYLTRRRIANSKSLDQQQSKKNIRQHYDSATYMRAVYVIQRHYRLYRKRQNKKQLKNDTVSLTAAAFIIQRTFRRLIKARRAKKHTAAALDQGDEVNDNASEAGSYTSASTALLSTESAGEHMEFGGNFEESVHQQTIKEDEEVENNYVNFDEKHFEETTKKDGQSINSKMWESSIRYTGDDEEVEKSRIHIESGMQETTADGMDLKEFDGNVLLKQNKENSIDNGIKTKTKDGLDVNLEKHNELDSTNIISMNNFNSLQPTQEEVENPQKTSASVQSSLDDATEDAALQMESLHREKRDIDPRIVEVNKESNELGNVKPETAVMRQENDLDTAVEEEVNITKKSQNVGDLPLIHKIENKSDEKDKEVDPEEKTINKLNSSESDEQLIIQNAKHESRDKEIEIETIEKKIVNELDKSEGDDQNTKLKSEPRDTEADTTEEEIGNTLNKAEQKSSDRSDIKNIETKDNESKFECEPTSKEIDNKEKRTESIEIEKKEKKTEETMIEEIKETILDKPENEVDTAMLTPSEKVEYVDIQPENKAAETEVIEKIIVKREINPTTAPKVEIENNEQTFNMSEEISEGETTVSTNDKVKDQMEIIEREHKLGETEKKIETLEDTIQPSNAKTPVIKIERTEETMEEREDETDESTLGKMENVVEDAILAKIAFNKISNNTPIIKLDLTEEKIEDEIDEPTVAKEIEDNIQEPSNEKAPIIKIEQTEETTEDDIDESTVAKMENIVEEAILAKMTINRLSNKDEQIHEKDESIEEVQIVVHERPIDTESLKPKTESDESLIERESRTKDQFIASVDEPSIEIEGADKLLISKTKPEEENTDSIEKIEAEEQTINIKENISDESSIKTLDKKKIEPTVIEIEDKSNETIKEIVENDVILPIIEKIDNIIDNNRESKDDKPDDTVKPDDDKTTGEENGTIDESTVVEAECVSDEFIIPKTENMSQKEPTDRETANNLNDLTISITKGEEKQIDEPIEIHPKSKANELINESTVNQIKSQDDYLTGESKDVDPTIEIKANTMDKLIAETANEHKQKANDLADETIERTTYDEPEIVNLQNIDDQQISVTVEKEDDELAKQMEDEGTVEKLATNELKNIPINKLTNEQSNDYSNEPINELTNEESVELTEKSNNKQTNISAHELTNEPTNEPINEPIIKEIKHQDIESSVAKLENNVEEDINNKAESLIQKIKNKSDESTVAKIENEVKEIFGIDNESNVSIKSTDPEQIMQSGDLKISSDLTTKVPDTSDENDHSIDKRSIETSSSSTESKDPQIKVTANELATTEMPSVIKAEQKDSSLLKSNKLIGTQNFTNTNEIDSNTKKLPKEKHIGSTLESGRLMPTPIAELQLKSFKSPADSAPWYQHVAEYNDSAENENKKENYKANDKNIIEEDQTQDIPTNIAIERVPRYFNGDEVPTIKNPKRKNSVAFFISFDSDDEKPTFKVPKKFLKKPKEVVRKPPTNNAIEVDNNDKLEDESYPDLDDELEIEISENDFQQFAASKLQTIPEVNECDSSNDLRYAGKTVDQISEQSEKEVKENSPLNITDVKEIDVSKVEEITELKRSESPRKGSIDIKNVHNVEEILSNENEKHNAAVIIQNCVRAFLKKKSDNKTNDIISEFSRKVAAKKIQRAYREFTKRDIQDKTSEINVTQNNKQIDGTEGEREVEKMAALIIQKAFRSYSERKKLENYEESSHGSVTSSPMTAIRNLSISSELTSLESSSVLDAGMPLSEDFKDIDSADGTIVVNESNNDSGIDSETMATARNVESTKDTQVDRTHGLLESKLVPDTCNSIIDQNQTPRPLEQTNAVSNDLDVSTDGAVFGLVEDPTLGPIDHSGSFAGGTAAIRELVNEFLINEIQYSTQEQSQPNEVQEEPCIKKTASITNLSESLESIKSRETKQNESSDVMLGENLAHGESMDLDTFATDTLDKATLKLLKPERTIEKMSQRQVSESLDKDNLPTEASFEEPIIKSMGSLQDQANMDIEDGDLIIYKRLQREDTRESSAQSDSVVFGETNEEEAERQGSANKIDAEPTRVQFTRHYTIAGDDPRRMFKTIDDDGEGDFEAAPLIDSTSSFCLDDETSEAIRKKIMAYSLSETDSDYFDPNKVITDDSYIDTAMADDAMGTSTETESTIVSAATKIQAGARGFLTRRRLRRASAGTKSSTQETKASFGNDAISESLERFIEEEAAKKIQAAYRIHTRKQNRRKNKLEGVSLESSLAARRQKLQRGDALRNDSTPDDDNSARTSINTTNGPQVEKISKKHRSEATAEEHKKSKVSMELKWPVLRQNSMPVQIDCEVLRVIPKHLRKRIRSAESQKKNRK